MSMTLAIRRSLAAQIAVLLAGLLLVLTIFAGIIITARETRQMEQATLEKARLAAIIGAHEYGTLVDRVVVDGGKVHVSDMFDRNYVLIKGYEWGASPRYHTKYDSVLDKDIVLLEDMFLEDEDFVLAIGIDENGYVPTHNSKFSQRITGNPEKDLAVNQTKIIANYPEALAAARNLEPSLVQVYERGGEKLWDVSAPIYVKGRHWGAFRVDVSMKRINEHQRTLILTLTGLFGLFFVVTTATIFAVARRAIQPVVALTELAEQISLGEALDVPVKSTAIDEIGHLTKAIDRLRASMKAAMNRLGH
ncbi:MAG TPA: HAMP domain-containing protein [Anaeromyxobacteraceae bacterium]|nr:HAMP domain-containing protein [Anaeromyxobacteraceae bacterium]